MEFWQIALIAVAVLLLIIGIILIIVLKKGKNKIVVDEAYIAHLVDTLGAKENISSYRVDNARVKFELKDLSKANLEELHKLSPKGVFVTNNTIKTLLKYDSSIIIKMLDKTLN